MQQLQVMNFLNEVSSKFTDAISLASGRPNSKFFDKKEWHEYEELFTAFYAREKNCSKDEAEQLLCQYGPATGVINSVLQKYLNLDESIETEPQNIIVTNGCQEALSLLCLHELKNSQDCMLTIDPSYIGFSGLVAAIGKRVEPVDVRRLYVSGNNEAYFDWTYLCQRVEEIIRNGYTPKAIYINPDFNNPMSYRLTKQDRLKFLDTCYDLNIKVIEDNPYSRFDYTDTPVLSLKALDKYNLVYHIGSFSKTFCPGVRIGYLVVPQKSIESLTDLVSLKSLISVNTSSFAQSVVGGLLIKNNYSLSERMKFLILNYNQQKNGMMFAMENHLARFSEVKWTIPHGGFFVVVDLPFDFSEEDVFYCAREYKVICMPVSFFSLTPDLWASKVRLAFSNFDSETLNEGVRRFSKYIEYRILNIN